MFEPSMYRIKKEESLLSFLKEKTSLSGREIKRALENGACRFNGKIERFGATKLKIGDKVIFHLPKKVPVGTLKVLYQDPALTLFNKPSGIISAPAKEHYLVHRLDKGTSGVLLMARTVPIRKALEILFKKREVKKIYIALVKGAPRKRQGTIENKLGEKGTCCGQTFYGASPVGRQAITHYKVLQKGKGVSLLELHPETGRTHQLRVHLSELGYPILGDLNYGRGATFPKQVDRLCLHAYQLFFTHPKTDKKVQTTAPLPKLFKNFIV
ncbi:MAG: RluA family pseudouridine synthase [Simkaniaceae bacterium]|nr:RluA family pseudouridine synthase [Simkaniaceae bacterium]